MNKGKNAYYIAEWNKYNNWSEDYSMLKGPNGFECCLTEPEDRVWYRDGEGVIGELNRLHAELNKPITEHPDVQRLIIQVETLSQETKELEAENKRLNSIIAFAVREHKKFKAELKAKDEEIANLKETIRAALRINCLWTTNEAETISEFEDEAKALQMMKTRFEQALKGE